MTGGAPPDKVLLVDDEPTVRALLRAGLSRRGFEVTDVASGAELIERFRALQPDILLVDAVMPGMDGFEACRAIRALPEGGLVPIVMLTGLDDDTSIARAYDSGATDFYVKSNQMTLLAERLRYLLRTARMQQELARSRARLARAQRIARLGSWDWNLRERRVDASPETLRILGLPEGEPRVPEARFVGQFYAGTVDAFRFEVLAGRKTGRAHRLEGRVQSGGAGRPIEIEVDAERDASGAIVGVAGTVQDVTERRQAEDKLRRLESFDALTGLANRVRFRIRFEETLRGSRAGDRSLAVLAVGLDRFKRVNESYGHAAGDELLREAAARVVRSLRGHDVVAYGLHEDEGTELARLGGDEFGVLLTRLSSGDDIAVVARRLLEALRRPYRVGDNECWITASIGSAAFPQDGDGAEKLLARAEAAMRAAKAGGRDTHRAYEPRFGAPRNGTLRAESRLRRALERSELRLHWQPIVDAASGTIAGAEVLMRWERDGTLVPPAEFIPLAEETGLIVPMGEWALDAACGQLADWRRRGLPPLYVGVNVAASHVQQRDIHTQVRQVLERHRLEPHALALEITESLLMDLVEPTLRGLHRLRELGVQIAIDDFGTGYSSLSYLKRLPVGTLKIDRSFVRDIASDADDAAIVSAIVGMSATLQLGTVAEGVETAAQCDALRRNGVQRLQGYHFGRPEPADAFERRLVTATAGPATAPPRR